MLDIKKRLQDEIQRLDYELKVHLPKEILKARERLNKTIADATGQPLERVEKDTDRNYWMSPEEALEYGIVGKIIKSASEL